MTLRVGLIGAGGMGRWHGANLRANGDAVVVAVADAVPEAAEALALAHGARVQEAQGLLAADDVDAVLIASPDETHADYAVAAIAAGKPCFCEKPLGATIEQAQSVLDAEVARGEPLVRLGFMRELDPAHVALAAELERLGPITRVRCVHRNVDTEHRDVELLFAQSMVHDIHTIRWLTGKEFATVSVHVVTRSDGFHDILVVGELHGGGLGTIEFEDHGYAYEVHVEATAERGMVTTRAHPLVATRTGAAERLDVGTDWFGRFEDAYRIEIDDWVRSIRDGEWRGPTVWDGYVAQVVVRAAETALASGSPAPVVLPIRPGLYGHHPGEEARPKQ